MDCWTGWYFLPFLRVHRTPNVRPAFVQSWPQLDTIQSAAHTQLGDTKHYLSLFILNYDRFSQSECCSLPPCYSFSITSLLCPNYTVASRAWGNVGVWMNTCKIASFLKSDTQDSIKDITQNVYLELYWDFCFARQGLQHILFVGWLSSYGTIRNFEDSI